MSFVPSGGPSHARYVIEFPWQETGLYSFRRAIWLNPYEPRFVLHLAHALFHQKRHEEALEVLKDLALKWPEYEKGKELRHTIRKVMRRSPIHL